MKGELIGINGRGSFDKRGRVNSGVGYAISINQIKNFLGHLRAGLDTDHATLGAAVTTQTDQTGIGRMEVTSMLEDSDVARRGLDLGDQILTLRGAAPSPASTISRTCSASIRAAGACRWSFATSRTARKSWSGSWACSGR